MVTDGPDDAPVTRQDVLLAAKAVYDRTKELVEARLKDLEASFTFRLAKMLEAEFTESRKRLGDFETRVTGLVKSLEQAQETSSKGIWEQCVKEIAHVRDTLDSDVRWIGSLVQTINSLPVPQVSVTVPENAIRLAPSQLVVPDGAIQVEVNQLPSQVNISDKAFHLTVDQPAPQVSVNVPQPRLVKKSIQYDDYGRPAHIEEQEA
jgi:hypothetical protein